MNQTADTPADARSWRVVSEAAALRSTAKPMLHCCEATALPRPAGRMAPNGASTLKIRWPRCHADEKERRRFLSSARLFCQSIRPPSLFVFRLTAAAEGWAGWAGWLGRKAGCALWRLQGSLSKFRPRPARRALQAANLAHPAGPGPTSGAQSGAERARSTTNPLRFHYLVVLRALLNAGLPCPDKSHRQPSPLPRLAACPALDGPAGPAARVRVQQDRIRLRPAQDSHIC